MTAIPTDPPPHLLDAALAWAQAGVCVLPAAPDGTKRPALDWKLYQTQRPDVVDLTAWLGGTTGNYDGIGIVCGAVSGNVEMFELEGTAVADGQHLQLRDLFTTTGFPTLWTKLQTYVETSPKGGIHWIYRVAGAVPGNTKLASRQVPKTEENPSGVQCRMETRGEGGWVICAPSAGRTHPNGKAWAVLPGSTPGDVPTLTADEHQTLHRLARTFDEMPKMPPVPDSPPAAPRKPGELAPGDDYNQRTDWADILVPAGWRHVGSRGHTRFWRRPGKNVGISATTGYGDQGLDLLYVFTTSTEFESERSYSKFGAYALLHCGGNFQTAGKALRQAGMGSPLERTNPLSLVQGGLSVTDETQWAQQPPQQPPGQPDTEDPPSWARIDLDEFLDGSHVPQVPELMERADGHHLLYRGRVHSFHGESESGKSWVALHAAAVQLVAGHDCLMIDFESDAHTTVGRLLRMGVPAQAIRDHFDYRRPEVSPTGLAREFAAWAQVMTSTYYVAIIDGVTEALAVFGVTSKDNDEVTVWIRSVPRKLASSTTAAVVLVDHVTKDADSRGRFAIGGQAKMAALDGAAYVVEVIEPLGVGLVGRVSLRVAKDRPGGVRPHAGAWRKTDRTQEACVVVIDSTVTDVTTVTVEQPRTELADADGERKPWQPTGLMERVSKVLENANCAMSRNAIASSVQGRREFVMQAVEALLEGGHAVADGPAAGGHPTIRLATPFRDPEGSGTTDPTELLPEGPAGVVPGSRSNDRGTTGTTLPPSNRFPGTTGNHPGTTPDEPLFEDPS